MTWKIARTQVDADKQLQIDASIRAQAMEIAKYELDRDPNNPHSLAAYVKVLEMLLRDFETRQSHPMNQRVRADRGSSGRTVLQVLRHLEVSWVFAVNAAVIPA